MIGCKLNEFEIKCINKRVKQQMVFAMFRLKITFERIEAELRMNGFLFSNVLID